MLKDKTEMPPRRFDGLFFCSVAAFDMLFVEFNIEETNIFKPEISMTAAQTENLTVERFGQTAVIRFVRPEIKNPLSIETLEALKTIFPALEAVADVAKIVFTGSGDTFASGANLKEIARVDKDGAREFGLRGQTLMQAIYHSKKRTVAAIDGFCMGGALDLALSCQIRIASPASVFAHPGANLGIITGWSGTQILPRLIGEAKALELFLTAKKVDANEALQIGLIDALSANPLEDAFRFEKPMSSKRV